MLHQAYISPTSMYYDPETDTLAIAGTHSIADVVTNLTIPFGQLHATPRYQAALQKWLDLGKPTIVGHSLSGADADLLAAIYPVWKGKARLYGAPRATWRESGPRIESFRHFGDPVRLLDIAASSSFHFGNPHSFGDY